MTVSRSHFKHTRRAGTENQQKLKTYGSVYKETVFSPQNLKKDLIFFVRYRTDALTLHLKFLFDVENPEQFYILFLQ